MKKIAVLSLCLLLMLGMTSCGKSEDTDISYTYTVGGSTVGIYYPEGYEVVCDKDLYQLKQPDSVTASIEEIMGAITNRLKDVYNYHTYMIDEKGDLTLEFTLNGEADSDYEYLMKAAVATSLFQIETIDNITFRIISDNSEEESMSSYTRESFYFHNYDEETGLNTRQVSLYQADDSGTILKKSIITVSFQPEESLVEQIINELEKNKKIPAGTSIEMVSINSRTCYLRLSNEFLNPEGNIKSDVVVYSIVNSITAIDGIDHVMLYVDDLNSDKYRGTIDVSVPMSFNSELVD